MSFDWSQIGTAPIFERGNYFAPGRYKLRLLRVLSKQTRQSGTAFIAEFQVLESDNPAHQIESKGTYFVKMDNLQQAFSNILEMMVALLGYDISNPSHIAHIDQQVRPNLAGLMTALETQGTAVLQGREYVSVECRMTLTKKGTEFTLHTWSPWTPAQGWQPAPTPAVAVAPQKQASVSQQTFPPAHGAPQPPAFAPPALPSAFTPPQTPQAAPPVPGQPFWMNPQK